MRSLAPGDPGPYDVFEGGPAAPWLAEREWEISYEGLDEHSGTRASARSRGSFIPVFIDEEHFRKETAGSGYEDKGFAVKREFLRRLLRGDERLILNPGSDNPVSLTARNI